MVQRVFQKYQPQFCIVKGCRVNLRDPKSGAYLGKGWKLATTHELLAKRMHLPCVCQEKHVLCQGPLTRMSAYYTDVFAKRVCKAIVDGLDFQDLTSELLGQKSFPREFQGHCQGCSCELVCHPKSELKCNYCEKNREKQEPLSLVGEEVGVREPLSEEERQRCLRKLMMLHRNTGHGPREHLVRALEARGTDPRIVDLARNLECSACQEAKRHVPRPHATLDPLPPKWNRVQGDNAHWQHPHTGEKVQFTVLVDEGCRFRVGRVMSKTSKGVSGNMLIQFFQEQWKPIFGVPDKIRLDPAGPWRSENVVSYFEGIGVEVDNIPAEAHWQISVVERAIQGVKHVMTKLARSEPEITPEEALSEALRVGNEKETVRGYSPAQHALGRSPDENGKFHVSTLQAPPPVLCENGTGEFQRNMERMKVAEQAFTEHVYNERLKRAQNSRSFGIRTFAPGDLVYVWRMQTKSPGMSFRTGGYTGPARVLATETRVGDDGNYSPGSVVWVIRGNRLLKTCPLQLRHASVRETCLAEIEQPPELPWTLTKLTEGLSARQYEDVSQEVPDEMEIETGMDEETMRPMKRCRFKQRDEHGVPAPPQEVLGNPGPGKPWKRRTPNCLGTTPNCLENVRQFSKAHMQNVFGLVTVQRWR